MAGISSLLPPDLLTSLTWPHEIVDNGNTVFVTAIVCSAVSVIVVGARVLCRVLVIKKWGIEDWSIIVAVGSLVASAVLMCIAVKQGGLGRHVYDNKWSELVLFIRLQWVLNITHAVLLTFTRLSLLFFLQHLTRTDTFSHHSLIVLHIINFINLPLTMLPGIFICWPSPKGYDLSYMIESGCITSGTPARVQKALVAGTVLGVVLDLALLLIPVRIVWKMSLPRRKKVEVTGLFGIGILACAGSLVKAEAIIRQMTDFSSAYDVTYTEIMVFVSGLIEATLGIIAACAPHLRPLITRTSCGSSARSWFSKSLSSSRGRSTQSQSRSLSGDPQHQRPPRRERDSYLEMQDWTVRDEETQR